MKVFLLNFTTSFHISGWRNDHLISEKGILSDTLYAALFSMWATLGKESWIKEALDDQEFALSSAFPCYKAKDEMVYLLPKPYGKIFDESASQATDSEDGDRKKNKKVAYFDAEDLRDWAEGKALPPMSAKNRKGVVYSTKSSQLMPEKLFKVETQERVSISHDPLVDPEPFSIERVIPSQDVKLYILVNGKPETVDRVTIGLALLGEEGIGSDRTYGNGRFEVEIGSEFPWPVLKEPKRSMLLSLYLPESASVFSELFATASGLSIGYDLIKRGGWITTVGSNTLRKNSIHMVRDGSVGVAIGIDPVIGCHVDLKPAIDLSSTPVFRVGRSLVYPINH